MSTCPNNCIDGWFINPYSHKREKCSFCADKRAKEIKTKSVTDLGLPDSYVNIRFEPGSVIAQSEKSALSPNSLAEVEEKMQALVSSLAAGNLPEESILFNLGAKVHEQNLVYHLIAKSYIAGLKTLPLVDISTMMRERAMYERGEPSAFNDYLDADTCVISIDAGTDYNGLMAVKGIMQLRGRRDKPTIILTHVWNKHIMSMCNEDDFMTYSLARCVSVQYTGRRDNNHVVNGVKNSGSRHGMSEEQFNLFRERTNLL